MSLSTALYIRLSSDDGNDGESNSVKNQRDLLTAYVSEHSELSQSNILYFVDDGYSGTSFNRPAVKQMLEQIKKGEVGTVVVKDFSRFGRNYIEVGDYLEQIFPFLGVRFISVNDHFDSNNNKGSTAGLDVAFKTFIHSLYSKELSFKSKTGRIAKVQKGEYLCKLAPYGYVKSKKQKNKIEIDENTAPVIRKVFDLALTGLKYTEIAVILNNEQIDTPYVYRKKNNTLKDRCWTTKGEVNYWTDDNVARILREEIYTGKLISGKRKNVAVGSRKTTAIPKKDWIVVENAHEAIISDELFQKVQAILPPYKQRVKSKNEKQEHPFPRKLFCGHCNHSLARLKGLNPYYLCYSKRYASDVMCFEKRVYEEDIKSLILVTIREMLKLATQAKKNIDKQNNKKSLLYDKVSGQINKLQNGIGTLKLKKSSLFEDFTIGRISKDKYIELKQACNSEIEEIENQIISLQAELQTSTQIPYNRNIFNILTELAKANEVTSEMVSLINRIDVFDGERVEIHFTFTDELERLYSFIKN